MQIEKSKLIEDLRKERFFLLDKTYQFINFGLITFGLGLNAIYAIDDLRTKEYMAYVLMILFVGATISNSMSWLSYRRIRKEELKLLETQTFLSPSYEYVFGGGAIFGMLAADFPVYSSVITLVQALR